MAKIKYTKNELKTQRDALGRFQRYLPTLQLKKQQLSMEVRGMQQTIREKREEEERERDALATWVKLYSEPLDLGEYVSVKEIKRGRTNIVGVNVPVLEGVTFERETVDLFATPAWLDEGLRVVEQLIRLRLERGILEERLRLLEQELTVTNQRVNLFEKVKIPETKDNIRQIRIFLGDQQTAAVARAKIAKKKSAEEKSAA